MTSDPVHEETVSAFAREGLGAAACFVRQPSLPVVDAKLRPVSLPGGGPLLAPTGHGGLLAALTAAGALDALEAQGVEHLFFFQYPNALERVCDPAMLGYHVDAGHDATLKGFREYAPEESVGRVVETPGGLRVHEYYYAGGGDTEARGGRPPGNTNTFVFSLAFLRRCAADPPPLPWHGVPMRLPGDPRPYWRAEQFLFDLLPWAHGTGLVLAERSEAYGPLKRPEGAESPAAVRAALAREYRRWLEAAGATLRPGATVEVRPSFAQDAAETALRVNPGDAFDDGTVLV
jgi:UDP-N-acetylglucosamine pyrophosphorylase